MAGNVRVKIVVEAKANKKVTSQLDVDRHVNAFEWGSFVVDQLNVD